jgi:uncharacterized protein
MLPIFRKSFGTSFRRYVLSFAALILQGTALDAASLSYSSTQPVPAANDVANFVTAQTDRDNILGNGNDDGAANDQGTYIANNRPHQGQTFTTGSNVEGYQVNAIWLKHVHYSGNTVPSYWQTGNGGSLTVRVTQPSAASSGAFALDSESVATTGSETGAPNNLAPKAAVTNSASGTGIWVRFAFDTPVALAANTQYGFDVTSGSSGLFFETHGIRDEATGGNPYSAGNAYRGGTSGVADNSMIPMAGDRAFMVELGSPLNSPYAAPLGAAEKFPLERVRLLNGRFKENQDLHRSGYLAWFEPDRLLYHYRVIAGLPQPAGVTNLGGWEANAGSNWGANALRGHMLGHYLTAASKMYAATGDSAYLTKLQYMIAELKKCQDAIGANEVAAGRVHGYLAGVPSSNFTTLESNPGAALVPFYTIHKTLAGLADVYRYCGIGQALDIAIAMSDYHCWRVDRLTATQVEAMFRTDNGNSEEWGGMNESLADVYLLSRARGDSDPIRHLDFAKVFHRDWFINPLANNQDQLSGLHANTHVPQVVGMARTASVLNQTDPERERLYSAAKNFWRMVNDQHWLVLGGNSYAEHFSTAGKETGTNGSALSWDTAETCNTYNMLKLTGELFQNDPKPEYADYYEHALYNHILASLAPDTGMGTYFVSMQPGHFKTYSKPEGSCWCCTGSGIENPAVYTQHIYFHSAETLWVNLFVSSTLDWSEKGMNVRMETAFPLSDSVRLTLGCAQSTQAKIRLRIPSWISGAPTISINGVVQNLSTTAGSYLELDRTWADGDVINLTIPMGLRLDHSMDDSTQVSILYGPILLAGDLGTSGMPASDQAVNQGDLANVSRVTVPSLVTADAEALDTWVQPENDPLHFTADAGFVGADRRGSVTLKPFYDTHHTRYSVYWKLVAPGAVSDWAGGGAQSSWSDGGNWDTAPAAGHGLHFSAAGGGHPVNDLAVGTVFGGLSFPSGAGAFVVGGNSVGLRGDVRNLSAEAQRIDMGMVLQDGLSWRFETAGGDLILGGPVSGSGSVNKLGSHALILLGELFSDGSVAVDEGSLEVGNGGNSGGLGEMPVSLASGSELIFNRADDVSCASVITGEGSLVKRGAGGLTLVSSSSLAGPVLIESGKLRLGNRQVQSLAHRWSFNGNLTDSVGGSNASVVDAGSNDVTLGGSSITLAGGTKSNSDYVSLGGGLLPKDGSPLTVELWATQHSLQSWSRIFDIGASTSENLFMSWSQTSASTDRIEWKDGETKTVNNSVAPYTFGTEYHIVLMIEPGAGANQATRVTWYAAPSSAGSIGVAKGSFETTLTTTVLNDANFWLGRSQYGDPTANASYNEVRLWNRAFSAAELDSLHLQGPELVGDFAEITVNGALAGITNLSIGSGAEFDLGDQDQEVKSLSGEQSSVIRLGGGKLKVSAGGDAAAVFGGSFQGTGTVENFGVLRLVGDAEFPPGVSLVNHGVLDIMTWQGDLPAGFVNHGTVLDRSMVKVDGLEAVGNDFKVRVHGYPGHNYRLQWTANLSGAWQDLGDSVVGADSVIEFVDADGAGASRRFYRVVVSP